MTTPSKAIHSAGAKPKIASAALHGQEPSRGGSARVAILATILAGLSAAATFLGSQWVTERDALRHLGELRDAAQHDLSRLLEDTGLQTLEFANDPNTIEALSSFEAGFRSAAQNFSRTSPEEVERQRRQLENHYKTEVVPAAGAQGRTIGVRDLYPENPTAGTAHPAILLQGIYLDPTGASGTSASEQVAKAYETAHERFHQGLVADSTRAGWSNLHLIDHRTGSVLYSARKNIETFTGLRDGAHRPAPEVLRRILRCGDGRIGRR